MIDLKPPLADNYSIWLMASKKDHQLLQGLIDDLSTITHTPSFEAHTTLLGLIDPEKHEKGYIVRSTESFAKASEPVTVEFTGVGMRNTFFQAAFLHIVPTRQLQTMSDQARQAFNRVGDSPFMPHMSLLYGDVVPDVWKDVQENIIRVIPKFPWTVTLDRLVFVNSQGNPNDWKIEKDFSLTPT